VTWRWGFFESVRLFNTIDWMDGAFPSREVCKRLFGLPAAARLNELKVGVLRWEYQNEDVKALIEEAIERATDAVEVIIDQGVEAAMQRFNGAGA
jgi:hypothetical protein